MEVPRRRKKAKEASSRLNNKINSHNDISVCVLVCLGLMSPIRDVESEKSGREGACQRTHKSIHRCTFALVTVRWTLQVFAPFLHLHDQITEMKCQFAYTTAALNQVFLIFFFDQNTFSFLLS